MVLDQTYDSPLFAHLPGCLGILNNADHGSAIVRSADTFPRSGRGPIYR